MLSGHGEDETARSGISQLQPTKVSTVIMTWAVTLTEARPSLIHAESGEQLPITPSSGPGKFGSIALVALQERACCRTPAEHSMAHRQHKGITYGSCSLTSDSKDW